MEQAIASTYKKYGYRMFDCSIGQLNRYLGNCYDLKKTPIFTDQFSFVKFQNVEDAIKKINSIFIPAHHGTLPKVEWSLHGDDLLVKELLFYKIDDQFLYQTSVERAWALGGHLDPRVKQYFYD